MAPNVIIDQIRAIMNDVFEADLDEASVTTETTANDIEEWDSLAHVRLMVSVERKFGLKFTNHEIRSLKKVGDFVVLIQSKHKPA